MTVPEAPHSVGPPGWRIGVAFGVVLVLLVALVLVARSDASPDSSAVASTTTGPASTTAPPAPTESASDSDRVLTDTGEALAAWGLFAANGDLADVEATFADGPQLAQLRSEAPDRASSGPGLPAFDFAMSDSEVVSLDDEAATVRTAVTMTRRDTEPAIFSWQIELRWDEERNRWMLYTVATVPEE